ncbi:MAG: PepSY domain-containing protein [Allosphingosinicella sp.]
MANLSAKIHKWLALLMAIQILFWFVSGLFFAVFPIEQVRSEHAVAEPASRPLELGTAADGLLRLGSAGVTGERIEIRALLGRQVALISRREGPPQLYDLATGDRLSPLSLEDVVRIAEADHAGAQRAARVERVTRNSPEYRGPLPAWRIDFDDGARRALYVAADTGAVAARRSTLWRVYDFLWGLHIMDWRGHENFNSPLLVVTTALGLVVIVTGLIMFPSRLGYTAWRRRRKARKAAAGAREAASA